MFRPEYPRPSFVREKWQNLNGSWDFEILSQPKNMLNETLTRKIEVPFCPESVLSGIGNTDYMNHLWYRRSFELSEISGRVLLHFGACDFETTVYVNKKQVGKHIGGYASFHFDITDALIIGENIIDVEVYDDTTDISIPSGKQSIRPTSSGCFYTRTTGIWQTVWLEFLSDNYISEHIITADVDHQRVRFELRTITSGNITAEIYYNNEKISEKSAEISGNQVCFDVPVENPELWEPGHPALYDIVLTLRQGDEIVDSVKTYCGFRKYEFRDKELYLNGKALFLRQVLDQGFYPDGIYTAKTVEDIYHDIDMSMELGFNGARPHEKVFEEHYFWYADKVGYIVWGEYPNWGCTFTADNPKGVENFIREWSEVVKRDRNHPSIMGWCPLNEAWHGELQRCDAISQKRLYHVTKALDPERIVIGSSGGDMYITDIYDVHNYTRDIDFIHRILSEGFLQNPPEQCGDIDMMTIPQLMEYPLFFSEYGGVSYSNEAGWGYHSAESEESFVDGYCARTDAMFQHKCIGYCYTQLTDVEQEQNGLYYYDRRRKLSDEGTQRIINCNTQPKK